MEKNIDSRSASLKEYLCILSRGTTFQQTLPTCLLVGLQFQPAEFLHLSLLPSEDLDIFNGFALMQHYEQYGDYYETGPITQRSGKEWEQILLKPGWIRSNWHLVIGALVSYVRFTPYKSGVHVLRQPTQVRLMRGEFLETAPYWAGLVTRHLCVIAEKKVSQYSYVQGSV